ncbi:MAG: hypothetical protein NZN45_11895, partial [Rhodovarius sp.]|nr:hypothetical protein [Rhodovarius sp.]
DLGAVVGDVNEKVALVDKRATVALVDCDSFQFEVGEEIFYCDVGIPLYQPPELQGKSYRGLRRTRNHDVFGLAVLIFQLLFFGRHPFAGVPVSGDVLPLEEAIRSFRFAWSSEAARRGIQQPPNTLPLSVLTERLAVYFERAFGPEGPSHGRPKAKAWANALEEYQRQLKRCQKNSAHAHIGVSCPICALEESINASYFSNLPVPGPRGPAAGLKEYATELYKIEEAAKELTEWLKSLPAFGRYPCAPEPEFYFHKLSPRPVSLPVQRPGIWKRVMIWLTAGRNEWADEYRKERDKRHKVLIDARWRYAEAIKAWRKAWEARPDPEHKKNQLEKKRDDLSVIVGQTRKLLERLEELQKSQDQKYRNAALQKYLRGKRIRSAGIPGIGRVRSQYLVGYGIETAADIEEGRLASVTQLGPKLRQRLFEWRRKCEAAFPFRVPTDTEIRTAWQAFAASLAQAQQLKAQAAGVRAELERLAAEEPQRAQAFAELEQLAREVAQAHLDFRIVEGS